jgi:hypothetical protein
MANIPPILKHMTLAIFRGGSIQAPIRERFRRSFDIAVSQCQKWGYISGGGMDFQETQSGAARKHGKEGARGFFKDRLFDGMFLVLIRERTSKNKMPTKEERPDTLDAHILGNQGFPKEAPHAAEPLYTHSKQPAKK